MAGKRPTGDDRLEVIRLALGDIASGADVDDVLRQLGPMHPHNRIFPGDVLLELAADAVDESGICRSDPLEYEGIRERYLPECEFRGKTEHYKSHYALRAAVMLRAGVVPDLLDEVAWWRADDYWIYATYALLIYVRVASERTGDPTSAVCERIAKRHGVAIAPVPSAPGRGGVGAEA